MIESSFRLRSKLEYRAGGKKVCCIGELFTDCIDSMLVPVSILARKLIALFKYSFSRSLVGTLTFPTKELVMSCEFVKSELVSE